MSGVIDIRAALETRLNALSPALQTEWENTRIIPTADIPYQSVNILFADPANYENSASYQELGYMQVDLRYPINQAAGPAGRRAQLLRDWFPRGLTLTSNGVTACISKTPSVGNGRFEADRYIISVKIPFFSNH